MTKVLNAKIPIELLAASMGSNKILTKIDKKLRRLRHVVNKETGVNCSTDPTQHLAICNVGQINGLTEEVMVEAFEKYGPLDRVLLLPGKSCSFLSYKELSSAVLAFQETNGRLNIAQDDKPAYLSYVETLPELSNEKIWNKLPPGLRIIENFITEDEEAELMVLCAFDTIPYHTAGMKHRQVRHFGYEFRYDINNVDKGKPLPEKIPNKCNVLWERLDFRFEPDQLTVNHYKPGQGIPAHIDTHSAFEDPILSLSLNSAVVMEFKKQETICVLLPRRSLAVISGESRYDWTHAIIPRTFDFYYTDRGCSSFRRDTRVSFTFRKVLRGECQCAYSLNCDSNKFGITDATAADLEKQHVYNVYEDIAGHFSHTRHKPWPRVLEFVHNLEPGSVLVDIGCGNGKYFGHASNICEMGTDRSFKLNHLCKERGFEIFTANCLEVPLKDSCADAVISIAVIHHLATAERRLKAVSEIARILRQRGLALIYVWAKQQIRDAQKSSYIKQSRKNRRGVNGVKPTEDQVSVADGVTLPVHANRTDFNHSDVLVPWKLANNRQTLLRFYHVFEDGELDSLCKQVSDVTVVKSYYDQGNYCVVMQKT